MADETQNADPEGSPTAPAGADPASGTGMTARLAELEADNTKLKDQLLRTLAEMENLRKRTEREVRDANQFAIANFARDMLNVSDNLRRAVDAVPAQSRAEGDPTLISLLDGVEMTEREMLRVLERHGVSKLDPKGERFDPNFHQAMFEIPNPEVPSGTVLEVIQTGYVIAGRVLRSAMVGVSKGGPKMPKAPDPASANDSDASAGPADGSAEQPAPGQPGATFDRTV